MPRFRNPKTEESFFTCMSRSNASIKLLWVGRQVIAHAASKGVRIFIDAICSIMCIEK